MTLNNDLHIRHASLDDTELLTELAARTFRDAYGADTDPQSMEQYLVSTFTLVNMRAELDDPSSTFLLGFAGTEAMGYAKLQFGQAPSCISGPAPIELVRLYLDKSVIGQGYGATLMQACLDEAARLGAGTIWLAVWDRNERAREFYRRWGFRDVGTKGFAFGGEVHPDPVMERRVVVSGWK